MNRRRQRMFALLAGLLLGWSGPASGEPVFLVGHEGEVVGLLRPYSDEDLALEGWTLSSLAAGPACEVRLRFEAGAAAPVSLTLRPSVEGPGSFEFLWMPERPERLGAALEGLILGNDPGAFFDGVCVAADDPATRTLTLGWGRDTATAEQGEEPAPEQPRDREGWEGPEPAVWLWLLYVLIAAGGMLFLGLQGRRRRRSGEIPPARGEPRWVWVVLGAALGLRLLVLSFAPTFNVEFIRVLLGARFPEALFHELNIFGDAFLFGDGTFYRPPAINVILQLWVALGDLLGVGGALLWFRLPTLALSGWVLWLLLRCGEHLEAPRAGRAAMVLFAFLPACVEVSITTTPYLFGMAFTAWFVERLLAVAVRHRPDDLSLVVAAGMACWIELVLWPLVAVGMLVYLWSRRGALRTALVSLLVFSCLLAPIGNTAINSALWYDASNVATPDTAGVVRPAHGFTVTPMDQPFRRAGLHIPEPLVFPWHMAHYLYKPLSTVLALLGIAALFAVRARVAWVSLGILSMYAVARMRIQLSLDNLAFLFPWFLLLPALGWSGLQARLPNRRWARLLLPGWVALVLLGSATADVNGDRFHFTTGNQSFDAAQARRILLGENVHHLRETVEALLEEGAVLVTGDETFFLNVLSCVRLSDLDAVVRCHEAEVIDDSVAGRISRAPGWETDNLLLVDHFSCEIVRRLAEELLDPGTPVLLLIGPKTELPPCIEDALPGGCSSRVLTPMYHLFVCGEAEVSPPERPDAARSP